MPKRVKIEHVPTLSYAIEYGFQSPGCHPWVGGHYFMRGPMTRDHYNISVALFPTRAAAMKALPKIKSKNPKARVVPIQVLVEMRSPPSPSEIK